MIIELCVFVALVIHHAMHMNHIVICGLSDSTEFFHIISKGTIFEKQLWNTKKNVFWLALQVWCGIFFILTEYSVRKLCIEYQYITKSCYVRCSFVSFFLYSYS